MRTRIAVCCVAVTMLSVASCADTSDTSETSSTEALSADSFSIVVLPDTQYYSSGYPDPANSHYSWPFNDQVSWVVAHHDDADKKIQLVIGLGDITDDGGSRPSGELACRIAPEASSATQWTRADNAIKLLDDANIPYEMAIGNHDYDCEAEHNDGLPQSRSTSNFDKWFGPSRYAGKSWFHGGRMNPTSNANFYNIVELGGKNYLVMALEFYPRDSVLAWANTILNDNPDLPVIVAMHAYLFPDTGAPGSGHRVKLGDPDSAESYHLSPSCAEICTGAHACPKAVTASCDNGNNGDDMWTKFVSLHKNIVLVVNGHFRGPNPGTIAPDNNGVGYRTEIAPTGQRIDQIVSDYQGQGKNGYFGNGYLRMYTISPSAGTLKTFTYSPPAADHPSRFPKDSSGHPVVPVATRTDGYNAYTIPFEDSTASLGSVTVHEPAQGATVSSPVPVEASYSGEIGLGHFEAWLDGTKLGNVYPANGATTLSTSYSMSTGAHRLTVLAVDADKNVIKSAPVNLTTK